MTGADIIEEWVIHFHVSPNEEQLRSLVSDITHLLPISDHGCEVFELAHDIHHALLIGKPDMAH